jgi:hypothetical protein
MNLSFPNAHSYATAVEVLEDLGVPYDAGSYSFDIDIDESDYQENQSDIDELIEQMGGDLV